ncbi:MAG: hypothetical protein Tsb002_10940 [Wenzhouxiangellaceae bacterium]
MACSTAIAGSNAGDVRQASSDQAHFRTFWAQSKGTRPMAVNINKEDSLFWGRKMTGLKVCWCFPNVAEDHE